MSFYKPESKDWLLERIRNSNICYASMEIALDKDIHTYSGGLGVLAGDTLKSCADLHVPVVATTLIYRKGYFKQVVDYGWQREEEEPWDIDEYTIKLEEFKDTIEIQGRVVTVIPYVGLIVGHQQGTVPVIMLDTDTEENDPQDRNITSRLYGGDHVMRLKQEAILGIAGKRILRKLGCKNLHTYHMNEGHAAFAPMEDVRYLSKYYRFFKPAIQDLVKAKHVFTTHTPVPAGHDRFEYPLMKEVLGENFAWEHMELGGHEECNMTRLALNLSRYANGVAKKHGEVSRKMFPGYNIDAITNGVHLNTWMCRNIQAVVDHYLPSWRYEPSILKHVYRVLPPQKLAEAHAKSKEALINFIQEETGVQLDKNKFTIGFARRFATYKRADLIFSDIEKLREIGRGKVQLIFAGEAHPNDEAGKKIISRIHEMAAKLGQDITVVFIPDYGMHVSQYMVSGCDLWLNNPIPPKEASGTSGMKAAANGVPNLSTLDGWWIEGITLNPWAGWIIEHRDDDKDHERLYDVLGHILRVYYEHPKRWHEHMVAALSLAHYFNTHRMVHEYLDKAWNLKIY